MSGVELLDDLTLDQSAIHVVGVVGAGIMGRGIAQWAVQGGMTVKLFDAKPGSGMEARKQVLAQLLRLQEKGRLDGTTHAACCLALQVVESLDELHDCDLVIEAISEHLDAKRQLLTQLEAVVRVECVLASNTSSLAITDIAAPCQFAGRVCGLHFFNPVPLMKVVEVIAGARTDAAIAPRLCAWVSRLGHRPVCAQDTPGFIVNHAGRGLVTEALRILQEQVATPAQIDALLVEVAGFRLGPFQLLDLTGLDVSHPVMESIYAQYYQEPRYRPCVITARRLAAGLLGRKSGHGFYDYASAVQAAPGPAAALMADAAPWQGALWLADGNPKLAALLTQTGLVLRHDESATQAAACIVTPLGEDVSGCVARLGLDARRTIGIDPLALLLDPAKPHLTLMKNPATNPLLVAQLQAHLAAHGVASSVIHDSHGFVLQRVLAHIINIACDMVQQGICSPADLDSAVVLGLGYPHGPLAWGDLLGPTRILTILYNLCRYTGDPRYRPSPWLIRRAQLGLSLLHVAT